LSRGVRACSSRTVILLSGAPTYLGHRSPCLRREPVKPAILESRTGKTSNLEGRYTVASPRGIVFNVREKSSLKYKDHTICVWLREAQKPNTATSELPISRSPGSGQIEGKALAGAVSDLEDLVVQTGQYRSMRIINRKVPDISLTLRIDTADQGLEDTLALSDDFILGLRQRQAW